MVTERNSSSDVAFMRTDFDNYYNDFGMTLTLYTKTDTLDSMGRITATSEVSSSIRCDIQFITKNDLAHINAGEVKVGDGMLYTKQGVTINEHDEVLYNSNRWIVISKVEGELVKGEEVYQGFVIRKNAQI